MVDATRGKLHMPNSFIPYLEKHRIYDLFQEMVKELVIQQPEDHILFLKEILHKASCSMNSPRVVILAASHINIYEVSELLADKCGAKLVTEFDVLTVFDQKYKRMTTRSLTKSLVEILRSEIVYKSGWVLIGYPKTRREAVYMTKAGILPTHVLHLIPPFGPSFNDLNFDIDYKKWACLRRDLIGIRDAFKSLLQEVYVGSKSVDAIAEYCYELTQIRKRYKCPVIPRVCILGPRGSGRKTQAQILAKKFNLVLLDFEYLLNQAWLSNTHLGKLLKKCRIRVGSNSTLLSAIVHRRALELDCLEQGWVLVGFPNTLDDFKNLDMMDTPPNRIVFLECDLTVCRHRILRRRVDVHTGSVTNQEADPKGRTLETHPKDMERVLDSELKYYCKQYHQLRKYCGRSACIVEGSQPIQWVSECISAFLMRPLKIAEPRKPYEETEEYPDREKSDYEGMHDCECTQLCVLKAEGKGCQKPEEP